LSNSARPAWDGNGYDAVALEVIVRSVVLIVSPAARGGGGLVRYFASTVWHTTNKKSDRHDHDIFTLKISHDLIRSLRRSIYRQYCFSDFRSFQNIKPLYVLYIPTVRTCEQERILAKSFYFSHRSEKLSLRWQIFEHIFRFLQFSPLGGKEDFQSAYCQISSP
jgi:hypothetical protein